MTLEALLAFFHLVAIMTMVVFMASEAALCRMEWMNAAVVHRLVRLDLIYMIAAACVVLAGLARTWWGLKGVGWYWSQPLLHAKLGLFAAIPAVYFYNHFTTKVKLYASEMDDFALEFLNISERN